jgi:putative PIN family toxin of toxin-antitoxin system
VRVVVDTNVWVSALLNPAGAPARVLRAYQDGRFELVSSEDAFDEVRRVLARTRIARKYAITSAIADEYVELLRERADLLAPVPAAKVARDPDDDRWIDLAIEGRADALVSRDGDVLDQGVSDFLDNHGVRVLTVQHFLEVLDALDET